MSSYCFLVKSKTRIEIPNPVAMQVSVVHDAHSLCKQLQNLIIILLYLFIYFLPHQMLSHTAYPKTDIFFFSVFEGTEIFWILFHFVKLLIFDDN